MDAVFLFLRKCLSLRHLAIALMLLGSPLSLAATLATEEDVMSTLISKGSENSSPEDVEALFNSILEGSSFTSLVREINENDSYEIANTNWRVEPEDNVFLQSVLRDYDKLSTATDRDSFARAHPSIDFVTRLQKPLVSQETQDIYGIQLEEIDQTDYARLRKFFEQLRRNNPKFKFENHQIHKFVVDLLKRKNKSEDPSVSDLLADLMNEIESLGKATDQAEKGTVLQNISSQLSQLQKSMGEAESGNSALAQFLATAGGASVDPSTVAAFHEKGGSSEASENGSALAGADFSNPGAAFSKLDLTELPQFQTEAPMDWGLSPGSGQLQAAVDAAIRDDSAISGSLRRFMGGSLLPESRGRENESETSGEKTNFFSPAPGSSSAQGSSSDTIETSRTSPGNTHTSGNNFDIHSGDSHTQTQPLNESGTLPSLTPEPLTLGNRGFTNNSASATPNPSNSSKPANTASNSPPDWALQEAKSMADFMGIPEGTAARQTYVEDYAKQAHEVYLAKQDPANQVSEPSAGPLGSVADEKECAHVLEDILLAPFFLPNTDKSARDKYEATFFESAMDWQIIYAEGLGYGKRDVTQMDEATRLKFKNDLVQLIQNPDTCDEVARFSDENNQSRSQMAAGTLSEKNYDMWFRQKQQEFGAMALTELEARRKASGASQQVASGEALNPQAGTSAPPASTSNPQAPSGALAAQDPVPTTSGHNTPVAAPSQGASPGVASSGSASNGGCQNPSKTNFVKDIGGPYREWFDANIPNTNNWIEKGASQMIALVQSGKAGPLFEGIGFMEIASAVGNEEAREKLKVRVHSNVLGAGYPDLLKIYESAGRCIPTQMPNPNTDKEDFLFLAEALNKASFEVMVSAGVIEKDGAGCPKLDGEKAEQSLMASARLMSSLSSIHLVVNRGIHLKDNSCSDFTDGTIPKNNFPHLITDTSFKDAPMTRFLNGCKNQVAKIARTFSERFSQDPTNQKTKAQCIGAQTLSRYSLQVLHMDPALATPVIMAERPSDH